MKPFCLARKTLLDKRQDVRFYIVGDGSLRKQLEQKAAALGIREHVTFTGFLQDVEKIEAALDIAVITSRAEALCLSILESMIAGIPAVGTDSGGVAEVIRHGENGFLIPVGDSDALAERLDELLADDAKRSAFGAQAKKDAEATFLAEQMTRKNSKNSIWRQENEKNKLFGILISWIFADSDCDNCRHCRRKDAFGRQRRGRERRGYKDLFLCGDGGRSGCGNGEFPRCGRQCL